MGSVYPEENQGCMSIGQSKGRIQNMNKKGDERYDTGVQQDIEQEEKVLVLELFYSLMVSLCRVYKIHKQ